ncbi:unnamed protein product [Strongylus vulgaris]|uniref:Uncharacterized protein n=1 Tax=Strongylus vulgaris TaxID=40348 RepID=A0A3P7KK48_STRVU|nr:unnamed protein product [Strongylus vulgaris]
MKGFILLELGREAEFLEHTQGNPLKIDYLHFILDLAARLKTHSVMQSLLDLSVFLHIRPQEKASIYDELIKIYGKSKRVDSLEKICDRVLSEKEEEHYRHTTARLAHFYR